jgi:thymidylate synthase ThyX
MISAEIIKHSTSWLGKEIITFVLEYPRYVHSELLTHRVFSKNSASSRAIPIEKFIKVADERPVKPIWTLNKKGMQGDKADSSTQTAADAIWLEARDSAMDYAAQLSFIGAHKQNVNRILEPWFYHKIVLTGTDFDNWYTLRNHKDAQPEIQLLAQKMLEATEASTPELLDKGQWHIPFSNNLGPTGLRVDTVEKILKVSVARCARVSYNNFDGTSDVQKDIDLYEKLVVSEPLHASPAEHQARVPYPNELHDMEIRWYYTSLGKWIQEKGKYLSNLNCWIQLRKVIESGEFA